MRILQIFLLLLFAQVSYGQGGTRVAGCGFYKDGQFNSSLFTLFGNDEVILRGDLETDISNGTLGWLGVGEGCLFEYFSRIDFDGKIGQVEGPSYKPLPRTTIKSVKCKCDHAIFASSSKNVVRTRSAPPGNTKIRSGNKIKSAMELRSVRSNTMNYCTTGPSCASWPIPTNGCQVFTNNTPFSTGDDMKKWSNIFDIGENVSVNDFSTIKNNNVSLNDNVESAMVADGCVLRLYAAANLKDLITTLSGGRFHQLSRFQVNRASSATCQCGNAYSTYCARDEYRSNISEECKSLSCVDDKMVEGETLSYTRGNTKDTFVCKGGTVIKSTSCAEGYAYAACFDICAPKIVCTPPLKLDSCRQKCVSSFP